MRSSFVQFALQSMLQALYSAFIIVILHLVHINIVIGGYKAYFSCINATAPLSAIGIGSLWSLLVYGIYHASLKTSLLEIVSALHLGTFFSYLCWHFNSKIIRLGMPVLCMVLFVMHPVGSQAWPYILFWLLPLVAYRYCQSNIIARAVSSTFIAHSIGSIIYLYCGSITSAQWLSLIPIVCLERCLFIAGMVLLHYGIEKTYPVFLNIFLHNFSCAHNNRIKNSIGS